LSPAIKFVRCANMSSDHFWAKPTRRVNVPGQSILNGCENLNDA
jgi:hypothetical protein